MTVYTKKGDTGTSSTFVKKSAKSDAVFVVLGTLDELNSILGLLHHTKKTHLRNTILEIQSNLMLLGSWLAGNPQIEKIPSFLLKKTSKIETEINSLDSLNKPIKNFILPGGSIESAGLHVGRTVARRLERQLVLYFSKNKLKGHDNVLKYINRLSDYLFVLARYYNGKGKKDIVWKSSLK